MKIKLLFLITLLSFSTFCYGQLQLEWSNLFNCNEANFYTNYPKLKIDSEENIVVVGGSHVVKYDSLGNKLWCEQFNGTAYYPEPTDGHDHLVIDHSNNIYIMSNDVLYTNNTDTFLTAVYTRKYAPDGEELWISEYKYYEDFPQDRGASIAISEGNVYVSGRSMDSINYCDVFLLCYDAETGLEKWRTSNNDDDDDCDRGNRLQVDDNGNIYVGGKSSTSQNNEYYLLKYDTSGNLAWTGRYENLNTFLNLFSDMVITTYGNVVMTGYFYTSVGFTNLGNVLWNHTPPSSLPPNFSADTAREIVAGDNGQVVVTGYQVEFHGGNADIDILTIKYDYNGSIVWSSSYDDEDITIHDQGRALTLDKNGNVLVGGHSKVAQSNDSDNDFLIVKYDGESGDELWAFIDDQYAEVDDFVYSIQSSSTGAIYVTGVVMVNDSVRYLTKKYREIPVSSSSFEKNKYDFVLYPNPITNSVFWIKPEEEGFLNKNIEVQIFNILGQRRLHLESYQLGEEINLIKEKENMYFVKLTFKNTSVTKKIMIYH